MERSFRQALVISRGDASGLWASPLCLAMWGIALLSVILPLIFRRSILTTPGKGI